MKRNDKTTGRESEPTTQGPRPLETLLLHLAPENVDPSDEPRERAWVRDTRRMVDAGLAALRRKHTPARATPRRLALIPDELQGLDRAGLLARLGILRQTPGVQIAHLELSKLSDGDLRQTIAEAENIERTQG
jgi:hypothetical protein